MCHAAVRLLWFLPAKMEFRQKINISSKIMKNNSILPRPIDRLLARYFRRLIWVVVVEQQTVCPEGLHRPGRMLRSECLFLRLKCPCSVNEIKEATKR